MAIDQAAKDALKAGGEYMPGRPLLHLDEEANAAAICLEAKPGEADKFYQKDGKVYRKPEKGSDEARERMAKVRAAKGKKADKETEGDDTPKDTEGLVGLLSTGQ